MIVNMFCYKILNQVNFFIKDKVSLSAVKIYVIAVGIFYISG